MSPNEIPDELIDQLLAGHEGPEAITGPNGLLKQLTKRVVERAMSAELTDHLGYELGEEPPEGQQNRRNGLTSKTLITDHGPVPVELPRDRDGSFEPQIVPKHERRFAGFDDKIISMYARGMSTREISKHLEEI
jgi:putative transposase